VVAACREGAPVSTPLEWREVTTRLRPERFTVATVGPRLRGRDPWRDLASARQHLTAAMIRAAVSREIVEPLARENLPRLLQDCASISTGSFISASVSTSR